MIVARDLSVRHGPRLVLAGLDLDVMPGQVLAIVGPNGAGKTTLLRALSGELRPDTGSVLLDAADLRDWTPLALARRRAVMSQQHALAFDLAVEEVVELGRLPWSAITTRAQSALACRAAIREAGAEPLLGRAYATLSGGEQARVQFARALAQLHGAGMREQILFLDEPTANLDVAFRLHLLGRARALADAGMAVVIILHDLNEALAVADRGVLLEEGAIAATGPIEDVLRPELLSRIYGTAFARVGDLLVPDYAAARRGGALIYPRSP